MIDFLTGEPVTATSADDGCTAEPGAVAAEAGPGLSKGHTVTAPLSSELRFWDGGGLLQVKNPYEGDLNHRNDKEQPKRGEIKGHSPSSQRRARMFLAKIPNEAIMAGLLITLTYPGSQAPDKVPDASEYKVYKEHLRRFNQAVVRKWNGSGAWFLEFQARGAPHYHTIVFGVDHADLEKFQEWVSIEWNRVLDGGSDHLQAGTRVEIPKNCNAARNYVTAYFTKGAQAPIDTKVGRYWGKFGTASIPMAPEIVEELNSHQAKIATRTARRAIQHHIWEAGWKRLKATAAKQLPSIKYLTMIQFRVLCENCRKGKITTFVKSDGCTSTFSHMILAVLAMQLGKDRVRFPRRHRFRNNSTVNLYCDAASFSAALKRHPLWYVDEPGSPPEAIPKGKAALSCFPALIKDLKSAYLSCDLPLAESIRSRFESLCDSLELEFEEDWNDATSTLFFVVRSGAGETLCDLEL